MSKIYGIPGILARLKNERNDFNEEKKIEITKKENIEVIIFRKYDFVITEKTGKKIQSWSSNFFFFFFFILIFGQKTSIFFYFQIYDINFEF